MRKFLLTAAIAAMTAGAYAQELPDYLYLMSQIGETTSDWNTGDGAWEMTEVERDDDAVVFTTTVYLNANNGEGCDFHFQQNNNGYSVDEMWSPSENPVKINLGEACADLGMNGDANWRIIGSHGWVTINVTITADGEGNKVEVLDASAEYIADLEAIYLIGENTTGWPRINGLELSRVAPGVFKGEGLEIWPNDHGVDPLIMIANMYSDDYPESYDLRINPVVDEGWCSIPCGEEVPAAPWRNRFYLDEGTYDITVDLNKWTILVEPIDHPEYNNRAVYACGSLAGHNWDNACHAYPCYEVSKDCGIFVGEVEVMANENDYPGMDIGTVTFWSPTHRMGDWSHGRIGPKDPNEGSKEYVEPDVKRFDLDLGQDRSWNVDMGTWTLVLDINEGYFMYTEEYEAGVQTVNKPNSTVYASNGVITVINGKDVKVFNAAGQLVSAQNTTKVAKGMYLVNVDGETTKVIVK